MLWSPEGEPHASPFLYSFNKHFGSICSVPETGMELRTGDQDGVPPSTEIAQAYVTVCGACTRLSQGAFCRLCPNLRYKILTAVQLLFSCDGMKGRRTGANDLPGSYR